jgi:hypothetical protein
VLVDDDVAEIDAHAKLDAPRSRHTRIPQSHLALNLGCAAHRVDDAGELYEQSVAGGLDDAPAMLLDLGIAQLPPDRLQCRERAFLVLAHQPRVAGDVGRQDRCEPPLDPFLRHRRRPSPRATAYYARVAAKASA